MWHIRYRWPTARKPQTVRLLVVATTRPETVLGDTGVAVNPEDHVIKILIGKIRYSAAQLPPHSIVGDEHADMERHRLREDHPAHDF